MARFKLFLQLVVLATLGSIVLFYSCFPVAETQRGVKSEEANGRQDNKISEKVLSVSQRLPHLPTKETALNNSIREHVQAISHAELTRPKSTTVKELKVEIESVPQLHVVAWPRLSQETISALIQVTQNEDLDVRSKWQRLQVDKYCKKYGQVDLLYKLPEESSERENLYRHLIQDPMRRLIFCFLPKVGCTTLRQLVFTMQGAISNDSINWKDELEDHLRPANKNVSFLNTQLTNQQRVHKLTQYYKYVMIRNPLDRLVSAYRSKIAPPLEFTEHDKKSSPLLRNGSIPKQLGIFQAHRRWILSKYQPKSYLEWAKSAGSYDLHVNFTTYVKWIFDSADHDLNEHFSSIPYNTAPCRVRYNLYTNFKNYSREVGLLIQKLNFNPAYFVDQSEHESSKDTHTRLHHYYSQLSPVLKEQLFYRMHRDLDFYYHLYPEDQWSHAELLNVTQPVLTL